MHLSRKTTLMLAALIALVLVVGAMLVYRSHLGGIAVFAIGDMFGAATDGEENFFTKVTYRNPFTEDSTTATAEHDTSFFGRLGATLAYLAASVSDSVQFTKSPFDEIGVPVFNTIKPHNGGGEMLRVSNEAVLDESRDYRALGYTGQRKVVVDQDGNILIAYRKHYLGSYQIFVTELESAGEGYVQILQRQPVSSSMLGITQRVPSLAIDGKNTLQLVWYGSTASAYTNRRQVQYTHTRSSRNAWYKNSNVSYVEGYDSEFEYWQEHPMIIADDQNRLFTVWEGKDEINAFQQIKFSRSFDEGATWSDWINIHPAESNTFSRPTLVYTPQDRTLHVFAYSSSGVEAKSQQVQYSYSRDFGVTWSTWKVVSNGVHDARHISATVVGGVPLIVYREQDVAGGQTNVVYQSVSPNTVGPARIVHASDAYQFFPSVVAIANTSRFCVSWIEEDTHSDFPNENPTDGDIYFACGDTSETEELVTYNLTPEGSHLYPNLPETATSGIIPLVYYDDDESSIVLRLIDVTQ